MKKSKILLLLPCALLIGACGTENKDSDTITGTSYNVVFSLNYENAAKAQTFAYAKDKLPKLPVDPFRDGYVFEGWYLDEACKEPLNETKDLINKNTTLHAKWVEEKTLTPVQKIEILNKKIENYAGNVSKTEFKEIGTIAYFTPFQVSQGFALTENYERYDNALNKTLYGMDQESKLFTNLLSETQYKNDDKFFYELTKSKDEKGVEVKEKEQAAYNKNNEDKFYNINYSNLANQQGRKIEKLFKKEAGKETFPPIAENAKPEEIPYALDFNLDEFRNTGTFTYKLFYFSQIQSSEEESAGTLQTQSSIECTLIFKDRKIYQAIKKIEEYNLLSYSPLSAIISTQEYTFTHADKFEHLDESKLWNENEFSEVKDDEI